MDKIQGLDELNAKLSKLKGIAHNTNALLAGAYVLERGGKERAAVDTGFMRASITSEKTDDGALVRVAADYGIHQEYGTSKMPAQPFIRPAIAEDEEKIIRAVANQLSNEIEDIARGGVTFK